MSLNEDVIRYLTIRVDEHEAGPSAMLRKRDDATATTADRADRVATARIAATAIAAIALRRRPREDATPGAI